MSGGRARLRLAMMKAFDHVFWEQAKRDARSLIAMDPTGTPATFVIREFYCAEPGCDCRRVMIHLHWFERRQIAATINYAFDPPRRRDEPQISLDPLNPQSEHAPALLEMFTAMIGKHPELRDHLVRHYTMWKAVVDDPTHPLHAKVRGPAHDDPSFRPAFPRRGRGSGGGRGRAGGRASRANIRGSGAVAARPAERQGGEPEALARVAAKASRADNKLQQRFKRLLKKVDGLRKRLHAWRAQRPAIDREIALYQSLVEQHRRHARDMVLLLDRSASTVGNLTKQERKSLARVIAAMAGELLDVGGHDDLKAIYNRHSRGDFDAEAAAADAASIDALKGMMEVFGVDLADADVDSVDDLRKLAKERLESLHQEQERLAQERRARRKKSARQLANEDRRADEQRRADKAVQDVYRQLAMALHPDREQDPTERARKAELMREVNIAYEAKDLLRLLELQLELERVDAAQIEALAEERVHHYTRVLDAQAKQLATELEEVELPFRWELDVPPGARITPADVVEQARADAERVRARIEVLVHDLAAFEDPRRLRSWLKTEIAPRRRDDRTATL
jgi:hypothetical protein